MKAYFDASGFAALILQDGGWQAIDRWLMATRPLPTLSDFGWGEFISSVGIRVRTQQFDDAQAHAAIVKATEVLQPWGRVSLQSDDVAEATKLVARFELGLKLPDAIHIAVARRLDQILVTTDLQQLRAATRIGMAVVNSVPQKVSK